MRLASPCILIAFCIILASISDTESFGEDFINVRYKPVTRDIDTKNVKACPTSRPLFLTAIGNVGTFLINTGQSIQTNNERPTATIVKGGPLNATYTYLSYTYYWASNATTGVTGTTIDKKGFPYGVRAFYINRKYKTFEDALEHEDGFVDLVFLFKICSYENTGFGKLSKAIQRISKAGSFTYVPLITHVNALDFISQSAKFYTYKGEFLDTFTKKTYKSSTVIIFQPIKKGCITQLQFNQTFSNLKNFFGKPLSNTLTHDSSELQSSLCSGALQLKIP